MNAINLFELRILDAIAAIANPFLDGLMRFVSLLDEAGAIWIVLALILLLFKQTRKTGIMLAAALILGLLTANVMLKPLVARIRPYELNEAARLIIAPLSDYSFPSGHAVSCIECATVLLCRHRRAGIAAMVYALLVCFSRLYLYVHFPTDVLAGILLGLLIGRLAVFAVNKTEELYARHKKA
ncbi:MAG: phosphatase PAP2 family protein [Ruminococcaceae bacterium]|nr:phosphatase PAP2 family protein [Oscillospiraceae bacterium]